MKVRSQLTVLFLLVSLATYAVAVPVHALDLEKAAAQADLIVVVT